MGVNPSTVTRLCDVLVHKRLIRRKPAPDNRRSVSAELTTRGRDLVDDVMDRRRLLINDVVTTLPPDAQRRLARSLNEFAGAAGELSDRAWTLGWPLDAEDDDSPGGQEAEP